MSEPQTEWNGEPVNVARGWAQVEGERIRVVRVFYHGEHFDLDDTDERGWRKVAYGHGSPRYGHKSVTVDRHTLVPDSWAPVIKEWADRNGMDPDDDAIQGVRRIMDGQQ
jgi:hypothetical protein